MTEHVLDVACVYMSDLVDDKLTRQTWTNGFANSNRLNISCWSLE